MPQYCLVKHHIVSSVIDGSDPGNEPDVLPVSGDVTFYPILDRGDSVVVTTEEEEVSYVLSPISARIVKGKISVNGEEGVKLFAGGPDTNPERVRYRAVFKGLHSGITQIALKDVLFEAVPNGELALSIAQSVPGKPYSGFSKSFEASLEETVAALGQAREAASTAVTAGEAASEHAQTATTKADEASQSASSANTSAQTATTKADEASQSATTATSARDAAVVARTAAEKAATDTSAALDGRVPADLALRVDTTVGTRVFAGDTMIFGDTGWRNVADLIAPGLIVTEGISGGFKLRTRRQGNQVFWAIRFKPAPALVGTQSNIHILPSAVPLGFKELPTTYGAFATGTNLSGGLISLSNEPGTSHLSIYTSSNWRDTSYGVMGSYITNENWPTSLPGIPA